MMRLHSEANSELPEQSLHGNFMLSARSAGVQQMTGFFMQHQIRVLSAQDKEYGG